MRSCLLFVVVVVLFSGLGIGFRRIAEDGEETVYELRFGAVCEFVWCLGAWKVIEKLDRVRMGT